MTPAFASTVQPKVSGRLPRIALLIAAPLWLVGWVVMRVDGRYGPGPGWTSAHLIWVVAFVLFMSVSATLFRLARGGQRDAASVVALGVALTGAAALTGQMVVDIWAGLGAADKAAMSARYDRVFQVPVVELLLFQVGPALLFVGLLALAVLAAARRHVPVVTALLVLAGVLMMGGGRPLPGWLRIVEGLGAVCMALALAPLARTGTAAGR